MLTPVGHVGTYIDNFMRTGRKTIYALSQETGLHPTTFGKLRRGLRSLTPATALKLSKAGMDPKELIRLHVLDLHEKAIELCDTI